MDVLARLKAVDAEMEKVLRTIAMLEGKLERDRHPMGRFGRVIVRCALDRTVIY